MSERAGVQRGLTFPFPKDKASKDKAVKAYLASRSTGGPMHYFVKDDGSIHYLDNKGNGYHFNDLATKLHNEAKRRAKKLDSTPTLDDYVAVFGSTNGPKLFETEQQRLREIYKNANTSINDVDHIDSLGQGGLHYSRNLRELLRSENRSEGARYITDEMRNALMLAQDKRDQIALQGPEIPQELRNLNALAQRMRESQTPLRGAMEVATFLTDSSPLGQATDLAVQTFDALVDEPVRQVTDKGIYEHIPNGSKEERRSENNQINDAFKTNNGHNGNGTAHFITNQLSYIAKQIANGKLPYNGH